MSGSLVLMSDGRLDSCSSSSNLAMSPRLHEGISMVIYVEVKRGLRHSYLNR